MALKTLTVNGKELTAFDDYDGTHKRSMARQLLARDEVDKVEESGSRLVVWLRDTEMNWTPPRGWQISGVSFFGTDEYQHAAVAVDIEEVED